MPYVYYFPQPTPSLAAQDGNAAELYTTPPTTAIPMSPREHIWRQQKQQAGEIGSPSPVRKCAERWADFVNEFSMWVNTMKRERRERRKRRDSRVWWWPDEAEDKSWMMDGTER
ncbi:hypothetical protein LTR37_002283 [Vermiconidia calcicola]|uniref:Uncharacterized protein n=1 Tax=Vermiconidia calcicola TaxID=1690605 RepID=A0ACC3NU40_9PEZI|nr:hypothetical protein LTR37_002283 [Vermiconidia calcicola]